mgnify:CR=1 FL=1
MKGKKFDAAEKHFEKKRVAYEKQIKELKEQLERAHRDTNHFRSRAEFYERENDELKHWIERLLEYTELTKEDIKAACEKDKRLAEAAAWLTKFSQLF